MQSAVNVLRETDNIITRECVVVEDRNLEDVNWCYKLLKIIIIVPKTIITEMNEATDIATAGRQLMRSRPISRRPADLYVNGSEPLVLINIVFY